MAARLLSRRESAVLVIIMTATDSADPVTATGPEIAHIVNRGLGLGISPAGAHATAASLVRKQLAIRAGTSKLQWYTVTQGGRDAVRGDMAGKWRVRP